MDRTIGRIERECGVPGPLSHFGALVLSSAGRDETDCAFDLSALGTHIRFYLRALRGYLGATVPLFVFAPDLHGHARRELLTTSLLSQLELEFEHVSCAYDEGRTEGRGYYTGLCLHIDATTQSGHRLQLVDGGTVDWAQKLLANARERLLISGIGSDRVCTEFEGVQG
jgi:hypothetical protein